MSNEVLLSLTFKLHIRGNITVTLNLFILESDVNKADNVLPCRLWS